VKRPPPAPAVVGAADHNGWAVLVTAAVIDGTPAVVDRRRVELIARGIPSQPYHHETLAMPDAEAERLLRRVRQSVTDCTALALDRLAADLPVQHRIAAIAIRHPPLDHLPVTVREVHASYHVTCRADGMLYHSAICDAVRQRGWEIHLHRRGEELASAATALHTSVDHVERLVQEPRHSLGPPWTAEHRRAFAAAIALLSGEAQLGSERSRS
jgi:hypothetical protein